MPACEYDHVKGLKLTSHQLNARADQGWQLVEHHGSVNDVHWYVFKRMKG